MCVCMGPMGTEFIKIRANKIKRVRTVRSNAGRSFDCFYIDYNGAIVRQ